MNITVTHTLAPEILSLLEKFSQNHNGGSAATAPVKEIKAAKTTKPEATSAASAAPTTDKVQPTLERLREATKVKKEEGKSDAIKALLKTFGVESVSTLPEDKYADFLTEVNAL